jgi:20S proteasome subunit beta 1
VADAAAEFRKYCYDYRSSLSAAIIVGGWDKDLGGQVYSLPLGGMCVREKCSIGGSGSSYIYGFRKEFYRDDMNKEDCVDFVKNGKDFHRFSCCNA